MIFTYGKVTAADIIAIVDRLVLVGLRRAATDGKKLTMEAGVIDAGGSAFY